jgi:hemerythrin-like domain-containing protein
MVEAATPSRADGMKRHQALEQLSRDHHQALVVGLRLKRAAEATATEARDRFIEYWNAEGREHFREEEEVLLPACAGFIDIDHPIIAGVLADHGRIAHLASEVAQGEDPPVRLLHELGIQLERHVRREERDLFPMIERALPDAQLRQLVALLAH